MAPRIESPIEDEISRLHSRAHKEDFREGVFSPRRFQFLQIHPAEILGAERAARRYSRPFSRNFLDRGTNLLLLLLLPLLPLVGPCSSCILSSVPVPP